MKKSRKKKDAHAAWIKKHAPHLVKHWVGVTLQDIMDSGKVRLK